MIQLKNVSKYYYSKGMISSGISKVDLTLEIGEFVVITGESGSGKTTLLNVISGLDSYEEGEMYIDGTETSHYRASDFEDYRKRYIGNIFQHYNLVNSYTVYQNIELIPVSYTHLALEYAGIWNGKILEYASQGAVFMAAWMAVLAAMAVAVGKLTSWEPMISGSGIPQVEGEVVGKPVFYTHLTPHLIHLS